MQANEKTFLEQLKEKFNYTTLTAEQVEKRGNLTTLRKLLSQASDIKKEEGLKEHDVIYNFEKIINDVNQKSFEDKKQKNKMLQNFLVIFDYIFTNNIILNQDKSSELLKVLFAEANKADTFNEELLRKKLDGWKLKHDRFVIESEINTKQQNQSLRDDIYNCLEKNNDEGAKKAWGSNRDINEITKDVAVDLIVKEETKEETKKLIYTIYQDEKVTDLINNGSYLLMPTSLDEETSDKVPTFETKLQSFLEYIKIKEIKNIKLYMPVNTGNNHWRAVVVEIKDGDLSSVTLEDSIEKSKEEKYFKDLQVITKKLNYIAKCETSSHSIQTNSYSCMDYSLQFCLNKVYDKEKSEHSLQAIRDAKTDVELRQAIINKLKTNPKLSNKNKIEVEVISTKRKPSSSKELFKEITTANNQLNLSTDKDKQWLPLNSETVEETFTKTKSISFTCDKSYKGASIKVEEIQNKTKISISFDKNVQNSAFSTMTSATSQNNQIDDNKIAVILRAIQMHDKLNPGKTMVVTVKDEAHKELFKAAFKLWFVERNKNKKIEDKDYPTITLRNKTIGSPANSNPSSPEQERSEKSSDESETLNRSNAENSTKSKKRRHSVNVSRKKESSTLPRSQSLNNLNSGLFSKNGDQKSSQAYYEPIITQDLNNPKNQAKEILEKIKELNAVKEYKDKKIGIIYPAEAQGALSIQEKILKNEASQWEYEVKEVENSYESEVIKEIMVLLKNEFKDLQNIFQLLPITICTSSEDKVSNNSLNHDAAFIQNFTQKGGIVMGWQAAEKETILFASKFNEKDVKQNLEEEQKKKIEAFLFQLKNLPQPNLLSSSTLKKNK